MLGFSAEWQILQNQYDSYEKCSLAIKLLSIVLFIICLAMNVDLFYLTVTLAILWLQDAIWKTFQSRIEERLYIVEEQLALAEQELSHEDQKITLQPFQFNREFFMNRKKGSSLLTEYLTQALRPTVAYPYVLLLPLTLCILFFA